MLLLSAHHALAHESLRKILAVQALGESQHQTDRGLHEREADAAGFRPVSDATYNWQRSHLFNQELPPSVAEEKLNAVPRVSRPLHSCYVSGYEDSLVTYPSKVRLAP